MVLFTCNATDCNFNTIDLQGFISHHSNHPVFANMFFCNQEGCYKRLANRKSFNDHLRRHLNDGPQEQEPTRIVDEIQPEIQIGDDESYHVDPFNINRRASAEEDEHFDEDCPMNTDPNATFIDTDIEEEMDEFLMELVLSLYGSKSLTMKHCEEVVGFLKTVSEKTVELCIKRISNYSNIDDAKQALKDYPLIDFSSYTTEHKFKQKLIEMDLFHEPSKFTIANEVVERVAGELTNVKHLGVVMDIEFQITKFLEIDGVLDCILDYQNYMESLPEGVYRNFVNGRCWKQLASKYEEKTLIPLFLYNDDFQIDDKVGPHQTANSLSSFYYIFPTLPPYLASKLDFIFDAMTIKAADLKAYGNTSALSTLVQIFTKLATEGLMLFEGTKEERKVYIAMIKVLGDNLGLHYICGFRPSFTMNRPCLYCEMVYDDLKYATTLNNDLLRTVNKYEEYFEEEEKAYEYGVSSYSTLNRIPNFHVVENKVTDLMHDVKLGYIGFFMIQAITYFIRHYRHINLELLNQKIQNFNYGPRDEANKPGIILDTHIQNKKLKANANESITLLRLFPLIVYGLIPYQDPIYQLLLKTIATVEKCYAWEFNEETITELETSISDSKQEYLNNFDVHLKPKDHHMLHYADVIRENGPLRGLTTIRLEAKHQVIRSYTNNNKNRRLIAYGVSKKMAFEFAYFLFKSKKTNILSRITEIKKRENDEKNGKVIDYIKGCQLNPEQFFIAESVVYNGIQYKIGDFIIENQSIASKITGILVSETIEAVILTFDVYNIVYDQNLCAYRVDAQQNGENEIDIVTNFANHPSSCHHVEEHIFIKERI